SGDWVRRYPPLVGALVATLLAVVVLPSALNVPQSNPTQTLEFAPVPPEDDAPPPPTGNVGSLSLGSSDAPGDALGRDAGAPPPPPPAPPPPGQGERPITKRCVGDPPRQTEDPMAPPCVAHFEGDNGGSTHPGVTPDEVRVLVYFDGERSQVTSRGTEESPANQIDDLGKPPEGGDEFVYSRLLRSYSRYFNHRFQTYGRTVHFFVHYGSPGERPSAISAPVYTPELRRADARAGYEAVAPFAVVSFAGTSADAYVETMADHGPLTFLGLLSGISATGFPASFFQKFPARIWSFVPSLEQRATMVASYVCSKVVPHAVSFSGNGDLGSARTLGIIRHDLENSTAPNHYGRLIRDGVEACGGDFAVDATITKVNDPQEAATIMAQMVQEDVTTIVYVSTQIAPSHAASSIRYVPEWVIAGDYTVERPLQMRLQDQDQWQHARVVTNYPAVADVDAQPCLNAYREVDPSEPYMQVRNYACEMYPSLVQLFTGIQVAGPKLTPDSMDRGFHAIPGVHSPEPAVPACFYVPGDYTCVKDMQAQWWDPQGATPGSNQPGCARMMEGGRRYLAGTWPEGDVEAQRGTPATDPCNAQGPDVA
ncbi:MAG TPA: hypothetical protein VGA69_10490, partial [Nitriliruptorales bacterium]